jgi:two-component system cell cycle response regulator CpdR
MGMKILVAEDSPSFALLYKESLEKRGHEVIITTNGLDCIYKYSDEFKVRGIDKEKTSGFDLVILDHKMPRMKGIEVAKQIIEMNPKQRILLVTGYVKDMMKGIRAVGEKIELLQKPFPSLAMIRQVEGLARFRWTQKMLARGGIQEWDGETGFSEPI